jgi:MerR family transcriptional regulator/heat shock protein HspR
VSTHELIFISVAARMLDMHPQTLRKYERLGLVRPARTVGSMRLYSHDEIERLRFIKRLVDDAGVNLAGVQQLLSVVEAMQRMRTLMRPDALQRDATRRRLMREMDQLAAMLGLDPFDSNSARFGARHPPSGRGAE